MTPTKRTPELVEDILERLSRGETLISACREHGISNSAWARWMRKDPELSRAYFEARSIGADAMAEGIIDIVDNCPRDAIEVAKARLRSDMRLRLLSKWQPDKYGDKVGVEHSGPGGAPIQVAQLDVVDLAKQMRKALRAKAEDALPAPAKALPDGSDVL